MGAVTLVPVRQHFLSAVILCFAAALRLSAQDQVAIELPKDGSTTIVVLDFRGGYGPQRKNQEPVFTIYADGNATLVDPMNERPTMKYRLSALEVENLLRDIVNESDFFNINHAEISFAMEEENRKTGRSMSINDASTTIIRVKTADHEQELRFYALGFWADRYPTIKRLQQLFDVQKRLERAIAELRPGVREAIVVDLNAANKVMRREHPDLPELSLNDFASHGDETSGVRTRFFRRQRDRSTLSVTVTSSPGLPPQITIEIKPEEVICIQGVPRNCFPV